MKINKQIREVKEVKSFLDGTYMVSLPGQGRGGPGRISWARTGVEKFYGRCIPQVSGDRKIERLSAHIRRACKDAISFGNSTIYVFNTGQIAVSDPLRSMASRDTFGRTLFEHYDAAPASGSPLPDLMAVDGVLLALTGSEDSEEDRYIEVGRAFSLFFKEGETGKSRVTPEVRGIIRAQARSELRIEISEDFYSNPQRYINGVWEDFAQDDGMDEAIEDVVMGAKKVLTVPKDPDTGEKAEIGTWEAGDPGKFITNKESRIKDVASAFNIDASELGFTQSQFSSASAVYQSKEDLVLEIQEFTDSITEPVEDFLEYASEVLGFKFVDLTWADPATPSLAERIDAWTKLVSGLPQAKYDKTAVLAANILSKKAVDSIFAEMDNAKMVALAVDAEVAKLEAQIAEAGGEDA